MKARQAFSAAHVMYIRSLHATCSALFQLVNAETTILRHNHHHLPLEPQPIYPSPSSCAPTPMSPPPLPPVSPSSYTWTSAAASLLFSSSAAYASY
ncbi:hypothetical protein SESBI_04195 [Sesbania bispinosa]|nr:hypothetical protein SESBI_04195 [Sesbania bispinosa]